MSDNLADIVRRITYPRSTAHLQRVKELIEEYVVGDYAPETPIIDPQNTIACIGSCFAEEMARSLAAQGRNVIPIFLSERWSTTFAVFNFVRQAFDGIPLPAGFVPRGVDADKVQGLQGSLGAADAIIITFGLSACWFEFETGAIVLDVPSGHSPKGLAAAFTKYGTRQTSVEENVAQILATIETVKKHRPGIPIILTVSPVPLLVSVTDYPVVPSNNISKAVLRVAVHNVMERQLSDVFYWPSYDIVEWMAKYQGPIFGQGGEDLRHISTEVVNGIMALFSKYYFRGA